MNEEFLPIDKVSKLLGVSATALRTWDSEGKLKASYRTPGNQRRYLFSDIEKFKGIVQTEKDSTVRVCCYCRVSSNDQKQHGDLDRQKLRLLEYCSIKGYKVDYILEEVCSGMKAERPKLNQLYKLVNEQKIDKVIVEHKDRLARFMSEVFKAYFNSYGVSIEIVEETLPKSFDNELVEDMLSLITSFSARLHSRRKKQSREFHKKQEQNI